MTVKTVSVHVCVCACACVMHKRVPVNFVCWEGLISVWQVMKGRLWKHVYDQMGGCSNNTSAATGTRRNYEKLAALFFVEFKSASE